MVTDHDNSTYSIVPLTQELEGPMVNIIRQNLDSFEDAGSVLAASFRRLESFFETYTSPGSAYLILLENQTGSVVGGAGIGPMAGLPPSEGIGEIRELVIVPACRKKGLGGKILRESLEVARKLSYKRLYLETTPQMEHAQRLFRRFGFDPIQQKTRKLDKEVNPPCYYMREFPDIDKGLAPSI